MNMHTSYLMMFHIAFLFLPLPLLPATNTAPQYEQNSFITAQDEKKLQDFVDHLQNEHVKYHDHEVDLFAQTPSRVFVYYFILILIFCGSGIALFFTNVRRYFLGGLLLTGIGTFFIMRMYATLDQSMHPKRLLQFKKEGIIQNNLVMVDWKQIKHIKTFFSVIRCNARYNETEGEEVSQEMRFINHANKVVFQVNMRDLGLPISVDDFLFFSEYFMKCNGITLGPKVRSRNTIDDVV